MKIFHTNILLFVFLSVSVTGIFVYAQDETNVDDLVDSIIAESTRDIQREQKRIAEAQAHIQQQQEKIQRIIEKRKANLKSFTVQKEISTESDSPLWDEAKIFRDGLIERNAILRACTTSVDDSKHDLRLDCPKLQEYQLLIDTIVTQYAASIAGYDVMTQASFLDIRKKQVARLAVTLSPTIASSDMLDAKLFDAYTQYLIDITIWTREHDALLFLPSPF